MAAINSLGLGSGVLTSSLLDQLITVQQQPQQALLDQKKSVLDGKISNYGTLKGLLSTYQSAVANLASSAGSGAKTVTSANTTLATGTATSFAQTGTYGIEVDAVATSQQLLTTGYSSVNSTVGTGTLTFSFGTTTYSGTPASYSFTQNANSATQSVTISSSNNTLSGIRDAINNANIGVQASIIYDGTSYHLSLTSSSTGASNSMQINTTGTLSPLAFNASAQNLTQPVAAQNAAIKVNGVAITSSTNQITGAINGVTINALQASVGTTFNLQVQPDTNGITKSVQALVDSYNAFQKQYATYTAYDPVAKKGGPLMGDATLQSLANQVQQIMNSTVAGQSSASVRSLADIGITTDKTTGQLLFNSSTLQSAIQATPQNIISLFSTNGSSTDSLISYVSSTAATQAGTYAVNVTQMATNGVFNGTNGSVTGNVTITSSNNTFSVVVDGTTSQNIALTQGTYTQAQLAQQIQNQINSDANIKASGAAVSVSYDSTNNRLVLTSNSYGSLSNVSINSAQSGFTTSTGLSVASGTAGVNVQGTINGATATGVGQTLFGNTTDASSGLAVNVIGGSTGSRGTVTFTRGVADQLNTLTTSALGSSGSIANQLNSFNTQEAQIATDSTNLTNRMNTLRATLQGEFAAYDAMIQKMNSTSSYLTNFFNVQNGTSSSSSSSGH